jgi:polyribonucleotide nucleotidyltransferase
MTYTKLEMDFHGKKLTLETGKLAKQAHGSVVVRLGDSMVLATACYSSKAKPDIDFFPLTVEFQEKMYSAGKIPGGFFKREARSQTGTLTSRLIDRPIRPLFPEGYRNEVQVMLTTLSYDGVTPVDVLGMIGASAALAISEIPFAGPLAAVSIGLIDGQMVVNPSATDLKNSKLYLTVAGTRDAIMMVESEASEISEDQMLAALEFAHEQIKKIVTLQDELVQKAGKPKIKPVLDEVPADIQKRITDLLTNPVRDALKVKGKQAQYDALDKACNDTFEKIKSESDPVLFETMKRQYGNAIAAVKKAEVRRQMTVDKMRADGRKVDELRQISSEVGLLPCTHGSAVFTRGETQALGIVTLGTKSDSQMIDSLDPTWDKSFYLHYNFPPYSVGEVKRLGAPGRREMGHGALAERALRAVVPSQENFPYTIRVVSEILESNGSSSMASVCTGSLAMMDAGVPIKAPVAGIAMGLVKEGQDYVILTDIQGLEDHEGDMDFKVAGTREGLTALQMDIKIQGITAAIMKEALDQAKKARLQILDSMGATLTAARDSIAKHAPQIKSIQIPVSKIGLLIGPGGKNIKRMIEQYTVSIDIADDGVVNLASNNAENLAAAMEEISSMTADVEKGKTYNGKVVKIAAFGAFIELLPGKDGLLHISEISTQRVERVEDVLKLGQPVTVLVKDVDEGSGKVSLTMKGLSKN